MAGVGRVAECVEHGYVEVFEQGQTALRYVVHVGEVGYVAEAKSCDRHFAMQEGNGLEVKSADLNRSVDAMHFHASAVGIARVAGEGVIEDSFEGSGCSFVCVEGHLALVAIA